MNPPYIPATALDGTLIAGWSGPCEVLAHARFPVALPDAAHLAMLQGKSAWVSCFLSLDACAGESLPRRNVCLDRGQNFSFDPSRCRMRLDPRREEVATRIATVLRAKGHEVGHLLPVSLGGRQGDGVEHCRHEWRENGYATRYCERCHKTMASTGFQCRGCGGLPEKFVPCHGSVCAACAAKGVTEDHFPGVHMPVVPVVRRTIPAADVSAVLLAASVAGVEAGRGVVQGVLGEWNEIRPGAWRRAILAGDPSVGAEAGTEMGILTDDGWSVAQHRAIAEYGPETGPEGRAAADAALLRLGYAYLDAKAPFGVVVPFTSAEGR